VLFANILQRKPREVRQDVAEAEPASSQDGSQSTVDSAPPVSAGSLARDVYDWAARLTAEASGRATDYYWTLQTERIASKLKLTKRALIGVVGVQGVGKTATMRAIQAELVRRGFDHDRVIATKVPESGGLTAALKTAFNPPDADYSRLEDLLGQVMADRLFHDSILQQRVRSRANHAGDTELAEEVEKINATYDETDVMKLRTLIPQRIVRELEAEALGRLLESQKVIMIDMPDYPKHDRRLIARDLDDLQSLWNRLMANDKDVSLVVFIQKETFNHADHFFYGKMEIVDLSPLTTAQLMEAYTRRWRGCTPFTEEALQHIAKMSRGVFRRFKRYITLVLGAWIVEKPSDTIPIDLVFVKACVTEEELMRDLQKELEGILKNREQSERAARILKIISDQKEGISQSAAAETLELNEMAVSRIAKELEEHGYIKRTTRRRNAIVYDRKLGEHVEGTLVEKIMEIIQE